MTFLPPLLILNSFSQKGESPKGTGTQNHNLKFDMCGGSNPPSPSFSFCLKLKKKFRHI